LLEAGRHHRQRLGPADLFELAVLAHQRREQSLGMLVEVERVAALDAEELAVDARPVAVVAADDLVVAGAERGLAAVGAVRADRAGVSHLPRPRLIAVDAAGERAHGTDVDTGAALVALQMVALVGGDLGDDAAVDDAERSHAQAFIAD